MSAHIASQSEERFVERGYTALVRATERYAARGDVAAQAFLPSLLQASPVALHRSARSLGKTRTPSYRDTLAALTMLAALITSDRSSASVPPLDGGWLKGYVVRHAGHVLMADNPDGFAQAGAAVLGQADDGTRNS